MGPRTRFQPVLADNVTDAQRVVLCSGKHYYTLSDAIKERGGGDAAGISLVRVEELSPFPSAALAKVLAQHKPDAVVSWAQEEPENQGAWNFVRPRLDALLAARGAQPASYAGRKAAPTTATGVGAWHKAQTEEIVTAALGPK
jgi:probable 2-oxoglutarate dehydrogenase E1 component DHKTD1